MFTKENAKLLAVVVLGGLIACAVHQKFVAPKLAPKKA
jgi:Cu/Ag efflux pump CusA